MRAKVEEVGIFERQDLEGGELMNELKQKIKFIEELMSKDLVEEARK